MAERLEELRSEEDGSGSEKEMHKKKRDGVVERIGFQEGTLCINLCQGHANGCDIVEVIPILISKNCYVFVYHGMRTHANAL